MTTTDSKPGTNLHAQVAFVMGLGVEAAALRAKSATQQIVVETATARLATVTNGLDRATLRRERDTATLLASFFDEAATATERLRDGVEVVMQQGVEAASKTR